jgi:hypothetical protein
MTEHRIGMPPGEIHGTAVVRDKDGRVKGSFTFGGPATPEDVKNLREAGYNVTEETTNGSHTDDSSPQRGN